MKKLSLAVSFIFLTLTSQAVRFEGSFIQGKFRGKKINEVSVSMKPEVVFAGYGYTPDIDEQSKIKNPLQLYEDLIDVKIDTDKKTVSWTTRSGLTDFGKKMFVRAYMKEGMSKEEATKKVKNYHLKDREHIFNIVAEYKGNTEIYHDKVTNKILFPSKKIPEYNLIITDKNNIYLYYLYLPEASGDAILICPTGNQEASWINVKLGKFRKIN